MKKVNVMNYVDQVLETVEVRNPRICLCGKEMYILHDGYNRMWKCKCMKELITKCICCKDWVYEDLCSPEDFNDTLGITFYIGHPHCMEQKARELQNARGGASHES